MSSNKVVITSAKRTAVGSLGKSLKNVQSFELGTTVIKDLLNTTSPTKNIEFNIDHAEVISGFPIEGNLVIAKTKPENAFPVVVH